MVEIFSNEFRCLAKGVGDILRGINEIYSLEHDKILSDEIKEVTYG